MQIRPQSPQDSCCLTTSWEYYLTCLCLDILIVKTLVISYAAKFLAICNASKPCRTRILWIQFATAIAKVTIVCLNQWGYFWKWPYPKISANSSIVSGEAGVWGVLSWHGIPVFTWDGDLGVQSGFYALTCCSDVSASPWFHAPILLLQFQAHLLSCSLNKPKGNTFQGDYYHFLAHA